MPTDWEVFAKTLGFPGEKEMWAKLYTDQAMSIAEISRRLAVGSATIHQRLTKHQIPIRQRGGRNNLIINMSPELQEKVRQQGVTAVATEMGLSYNTLHKALKRAGFYSEETPQSPAQSEPPRTPDSPGD